jgi:hypothetical protein
MTFENVLEAVSRLPREQQEILADIVKKRCLEMRREEILQESREALAEYREGNLKPMTAAEAIALLHRDLQENEEWSTFSLEQAMRGLDDDNLPEYTEADLVEKCQ